ncbi:MAG: DNA internalization-related competence protein ComEC/Rec2 [Deltaproteobacteria bacterium]|nr:DNA internalization-related competence protein ComEC/Rec2 [Deltaproteobacteria bacterium]
MKQPLLPLIVAFMAGIITGSYAAVPQELLLAGFLSTVVLLLVFGILLKKSSSIPWLLLSVYLLGILNIHLYLHGKPSLDHILHYAGKGKITIEGIICENPRVFPDRKELIISARMTTRDGLPIPVQGLVLLSLKTDDSFHYGDYILCKTNLRFPRNFKNPGGFDYERSLRYRNILVRGFIKDSSEIIVLRKNQGNVLRSTIENFRKKLKNFIGTNSPSPQGEIIQALTLGEQQAIPRDVRNRFNMTGTSHILSVSGFHVGTIAVLSIFIISLLLKRSEYLLLRIDITKIATLFALPAVILYASISGMSFPAIRATIMSLALLVAILLNKEKNLYNILALAAFMILVVSPPALFSVSFQLSFAAIISLLYITPRISALFLQQFPENGATKPRLHWLFMNFYRFVAVSLGAALGTAPIVALYFNRVSSMVIIANLLIVPLLGMIALPLCLAIIIAYPLSQAIAYCMLKTSLFFVTISLSFVDYLAAIPGGSFIVTTPTLAEIAFYYLFIILVVELIDLHLPSPRPEHAKGKTTRGRLIKFGLGFCVLFFLTQSVYLHIRNTNKQYLHLTAIDVGQGSSTLIEFPGGRKMLVDGGGLANTDFDMGKYVIAPFLWQKRIKNVDILVLTHPHPDHLHGLIYILDHFSVREVWTNGQESPENMYRDFIRKMNANGITHRIISEKTELSEVGAAKIMAFNPRAPLPKRPYERFDVINNDSLVIKLTLGETSVLLPGDISEPTEMRLVRKKKNLKSDILLVPHHGGRSSSTISFLKRVQPRIALISCGAGNTFGDPHPDVLRRLRMLNTRIFRTDNDGAITISTDGRKINLHTFMGQDISLAPINHFPP